MESNVMRIFYKESFNWIYDYSIRPPVQPLVHSNVLATKQNHWYAHRRRTFRLERNPYFNRCAVLLNAQILGILAATYILTYDFVVQTIPHLVEEI